MRGRTPIFFFSSILKYRESKLINCNPQLFFNVIYDVKKYKEFLPWCDDSVILRYKNKTDFDAELTINFKLFTESYISKVTLQETNNSLVIVSDSSNTNIFEKLTSTWEIQKKSSKAGSGLQLCEYNYEIDFMFKNILYQQAASFFLNTITKNMSSCFEKRALELVSRMASEESINKQENPNKGDAMLGQDGPRNTPAENNSLNHEKKRRPVSFFDGSKTNESLILDILSELYKEKKLTKVELDSLVNIFAQNLPTKNTILNLFRVHGNNISDKEIRVKTAFLLREMLSNMGP